MDQQFKIAQITAAHGIRGEVKLLCFLENADDLVRYMPLVNKQGKPFSLTITGHVKDQLIARVDGVKDRNEAELLRGVELFSSRAKLPRKSAAEFYHSELVGLSAVDGNGDVIGKVVAVHNFGAGDIVEIQTANGEIMLPFKAPFVGDIEVDKGTMTVALPDYIEDETP